MMEYENNEIEIPQQIQELMEENEKLMKKSFRMIISFFSLLVVCVVLFVVLQSNKFFIFNLKRSFVNVPSPLIAEIFSMFFLVVVILALISYVVFTVEFAIRKTMDEDEIIESFLKFKKKYNFADVFSVVPAFLVVAMVINGFFFSFAQVDGVSMQPTFCDGDPVIIKYVSDYEVDDIVIIEEEDIYLIKRLVAVAGDQLLVNSSGVYVNGVLVESNIGNDFIPYNNVIIPEGSYYVLGDNRRNSQDSRYFGLKSDEDMLGIVVLRMSDTACPLS